MLITNVEVPEINYKKTKLKDAIKHASWSLCYVCQDKYHCSNEIKSHRHCIPAGKAKAINTIIDFYYACLKAQKKEGDFK